MEVVKSIFGIDKVYEETCKSVKEDKYVMKVLAKRVFAKEMYHLKKNNGIERFCKEAKIENYKENVVVNPSSGRITIKFDSEEEAVNFVQVMRGETVKKVMEV